MSEIAESAAENRISIVMGLTERSKESEQYYNTNVVIGSDGRILTAYHKTHLFGPRERALLTPGDTLETSLFTIDGVRCATLICYDMEFPEAVRVVALRGAQCLLVSSGNWFPLEHAQLWHRFSRAVENQIFVGYSMRTGENDLYKFHGGSAITGPRGECLASAELEETILCATVDTRVLDECRSEYEYRP